MCSSRGEDTPCLEGYAGIGLKLRLHDCLKELSHVDILSCIGHAQNYSKVEENLKIIVY